MFVRMFDFILGAYNLCYGAPKMAVIADHHQDLKTQVFFYLEAALMEYFLEAVSSSIRKRILKSYSFCNFF